PPGSTLCPYTPLFRSTGAGQAAPELRPELHRLRGQLLLLAIGHAQQRRHGFGALPRFAEQALRAAAAAGGLQAQAGRNAVAERRSEEHTSELQSRENL